MGSVLKIIGGGIKRAFSRDGGGIVKVKNILGNKDGEYYIAMAVRTITGVVATYLVYLFAGWTGVPVPEFLETAGTLLGL